MLRYLKLPWSASRGRISFPQCQEMLNIETTFLDTILLTLLSTWLHYIRVLINSYIWHRRFHVTVDYPDPPGVDAQSFLWYLFVFCQVLSVPLSIQLRELEVKPWWYLAIRSIPPSSLNAPSKKQQATSTVRAASGTHTTLLRLKLWMFILLSRSWYFNICQCSDYRSFVIQQIPSSNLFMVVVDNKCDCSSVPPVTMDPIEIMYILSTTAFTPSDCFYFSLHNLMWYKSVCMWYKSTNMG